MAKKSEKNIETSAEKVEVQRFKGWQLLRLPKYKGRIAKLVIKEDGLYSFEEADKAISNFMKKKG